MEAGLRSAYALNRHVSQLCIALSHSRCGSEHTRKLQSTKAAGIMTRIAQGTGGRNRWAEKGFSAKRSVAQASRL